MKKLWILMIFTPFIASCSSLPEKQTTVDGVTILCPKGWVLKQSNGSANPPNRIILNKEGKGDHGLYYIGWESDTIAVDQVFREIQRAQQKAHKDIEIGTVSDGTFNGITSQAYEYSMTASGNRYFGSVHVFYHCGRVFAIDASGNKSDRSDFETIEKSFVCE